jgi:hypothetical protein
VGRVRFRTRWKRSIFGILSERSSKIRHFLLGYAESSLGDAESSLGDAESSLGDAESSLGDAKTTPWG